MSRNVYFSHGTKNEQYLMEDLIIEAISIWGNDFYYIPRTLVAKDEILGEDRLSQFKTAYPIEMYLETVDGFEGQGAFIQKFGLMMEQSATLTVARRRWDQLVGQFGQTQLPNRPCEGDLLYFPLTNGLFEIKFVQHQDPFYQIGKLQVYKLSIELFQYSSEKIDTGIKEIDIFENMKTFDTDLARNQSGYVTKITMIERGSGYETPPVVTITGDGDGAYAQAVLGTGSNAGKVVAIEVLSGGSSYNTVPTVTVAFPPTGGVRATAHADISIDIRKPDSYGDNINFDNGASDIIVSKSTLA